MIPAVLTTIPTCSLLTGQVSLLAGRIGVLNDSEEPDDNLKRGEAAQLVVVHVRNKLIIMEGEKCQN